MDSYKVSTAVLSVIIIAVGIGFLMKDKVGTLPPVQTAGIKEFSYAMVLFLPHIVVVFGFLADALSRDFRYSIPSIAGFLSIFANWALGLGIGRLMDAMKSAPPTAPAPIVGGGAYGTGCFVPGFESFNSDYSSAPLVVTFTVMFYYVIDLLQNRGFGTAIPSVIAMVAFAISQFMVLRANGCFAKFSSAGIPLATSALIGLLFGGSVYGIILSSMPDRLPSNLFARESQSAPPSAPGGGGKKGCSSGKCDAPADDDQFVCDTYINGVPVRESD